ncbi:3-(methylthio)propionyl-CoA ligase [Alkalimarinus sediminis]|uniref:3-(Methylthio)propionyl-CoA ligase n=1 Tax=Alkalimarinus sediminis TaxID=1632866 RepID=A0A9E8HJ39_9ALTE|nr:3-(methylthio)propionyl-CoA ligase [Alkalimarinus sediminis]UZW75122.1 3-(methylthio)propionyl-CoA ligase [Alkalimarinus sediminis]
MHGLMMNTPLTVSSILQYAEQYHQDGEIVSRNVEGGIHRYSYKDAAARSRRLANGLKRLGVQQQDRVATLAWNTHRHYEVYFAVSGSGAILHTINPRLFPDQLAYILNHAEDEILFIDLTFIPLLEKIAPELRFLKQVVVMTNRESMPESPLPDAIPFLCYDALVDSESEAYEWPEVDEESAASLCYTSGTTGNPKGVLYSHRSTVLHAWASISRDALDIGNSSNLLPVVPMFHVNAWGVPYSATMVGAKLVLPGAGMDGASLSELVDKEQVDLLLGVPTVWQGLLQYCEQQNITLNPVKTVVIGGSAAPLSMIKSFQEDHDAFVMHAWGMTELSPIGTINSMNRHMKSLSLDERYQLQTKQGRPVFGIEMKIVGTDNQILPHDGDAFGRLMVKGPWVISRYYKEEKSSLIDGWFDTGDVATIDPQGYMNIVDRAKDVIKSGGEWISSIDLENAAVGHPAIAECAVIGVPHPKWDERPLLLAVLKEGENVSKEQIIDYLSDKVVKWWLPDDVIFVTELPHTATGKLLKMKLRETYHGTFSE